MIVVIGSPIGWLRDEERRPGRYAGARGPRRGRGGRAVQLVGRTATTRRPTALLLGLARGGVGHVALLRDPARATPLVPEPAMATTQPAMPDDEAPARAARARRRQPTLDAGDVDLGLRYLTDYAVVVLAEPVDPDVVAGRRRRGELERCPATWSSSNRAPSHRRTSRRTRSCSRPRPRTPTATLRRWSVGSPRPSTTATDAGDAFRSSLAEEGWTEAVAD